MELESPPGVVIRLEEPQDHRAAADVQRRAFEGEGYAESQHVVRIVQDVRSEEGSFALVAADGDRIIGHVQFSRAWAGEAPILTLSPLGVAPDRQRQGIGSALVIAGLAEARRRDEVAVVLLGNPVYYQRFGFRPGSEFGLRNPAVGVTPEGFEILEEHFMLAPLRPSIGRLAGDVRWHPAID